MPKFKVKVQQFVQEVATIEVEAANDLHAAYLVR